MLTNTNTDYILPVTEMRRIKKVSFVSMELFRGKTIIRDP